jgi:TRAP-type uncharacterized transport system fused permease subunit
LRGSAMEVMAAVATSSVGVIVLGAAVMGYFVTNLRAWETAALLAASLLTIKVGWLTDLLGLSLITMVFVVQWRRRGRGPECAEPVGELEGRSWKTGGDV